MNTNCRECIDNQRPMDPRASFRGLVPTCETCAGQYKYSSALKEAMEKKEIMIRLSQGERVAVERLQGRVMHVENKLNEHIDYAKKRRGKY